jgi:hypothetical protein
MMVGMSPVWMHPKREAQPSTVTSYCGITREGKRRKGREEKGREKQTREENIREDKRK